tara:strand:- start:170 stop:433 length:264 start_codon:yes stop_codon:yes gene_type:complete
MSAIKNKPLGIFETTQENAFKFMNNLLLATTFNQCVQLWKEAETEYQRALLLGDEETIKIKQAQMQTYQSSLVLTAHIFDEVDEIST